MKRPTIVLALLSACAAASADPGVMLGVSYNFGGTPGLTLKVLSSDQRDRAVAAVGVSYFPLASAQRLGVDLSGGYNFRHGAATVGWDFLNRRVQGAVGWSDTRER
jgi:hypothetical protein